MGLGLYKPGQGYWVRVITAVCAGMLVLAAAAWLYAQLATFPIPRSAYDIGVREAVGSVAPGARVELMAPGLRLEDPPIRVGSASVLSAGVSPTGEGVLRLHKLELGEGQTDPAAARSVLVPQGSGAMGDSGETFRAQVEGVTGIPAIEPLYLQGGVSALVIMIGAAIIYLFVASRPSSSEFLIATDGEMKKVNWSTRREIVGSTWVVVVACFLLAAALFLVDLAFSNFFQIIRVIET